MKKPKFFVDRIMLRVNSIEKKSPHSIALIIKEELKVEVAKLDGLPQEITEKKLSYQKRLLLDEFKQINYNATTMINNSFSANILKQIDMKKYYFTFGQIHTHPRTGENMKDYWITVEAESYDKARESFMEYWKSIKWSFQYEEGEFNSHLFPKGEYIKITQD